MSNEPKPSETPKRFNFTQYTSGMSIWHEMTEEPLGDYVQIEDYFKLEQQLRDLAQVVIDASRKPGVGPAAAYKAAVAVIEQLSQKGGDELCAALVETPLVDPSHAHFTESKQASKAPPTSEPEAGATPETDEITRLLGSPSGEEIGHRKDVPRWFSQKLERQRNAALARVEELGKKLDEALLWKEQLYLGIMFGGEPGEIAPNDVKEAYEALALMRTQNDADAKEIAELNNRIESLAFNRLEADLRFNNAEAACAAMREAIERQLAVNKEVNKLPTGNFYLPETIESFLRGAAVDCGTALLERLKAAEADAKRWAALRENMWFLFPRGYRGRDGFYIKRWALCGGHYPGEAMDRIAWGTTRDEAIDAAIARKEKE